MASMNSITPGLNTGVTTPTGGTRVRREQESAGPSDHVSLGGKLDKLANLKLASSVAGMVGSLSLGAMAATAGGLGYAASAGVLGSILGAVTGTLVSYNTAMRPIDDHRVTDSGVHKHWQFDPKTDLAGRGDYSLPNGTTISDDQGHGKLTARDALGLELKAERAKDSLGHNVIRVTNSQGVITELDTNSLDFSIASPREGQAQADYRELKQTVHADGSTEMIIGEQASWRMAQGPDPLHVGETVETKVPESHSYIEVKLHDGHSEVAQHNQDFGRTQGESVDGNRYATSLDPSGSSFQLLSQSSGFEIGTEVKPFVSLDQMQEAREAARTELREEKLGHLSRDYKEPVRLEQPNGSVWQADLQGNRLSLFKEHGLPNHVWLDANVSGSPILTDNMLYVADEGNKLYGFSNETGIRSFATDLNGQLHGQPVVDAEGNLKVTLEKGGRILHRTLDPATGEVLSSQLEPNS